MREATIMARVTRSIGRHVACGGQMLALDSEIKPGVPFQICAVCDNVPRLLIDPKGHHG